MCRLVREHSARSTIVVGGHVAAIPGLQHLIDADHIVRGEGVSWFRRFLGEPADRPIEHPLIPSAFGFRLMGLRGPGRGNPAATIIPSVGCPMGCNFCTTSAFFGGKGKFVNFFERGSQLFKAMCDAESSLGVKAFFMMDENFLLYRERALELLEHMKATGKAWSLYVFSSANALSKYTMRELVELGVSWVWMGLESAGSRYRKLKGADTRALVEELRAHGISVLGSTIVGLEHHTPDNIAEEIEYAASHDTDFHQFMLYTPVPGTPLYQEMVEQGRLLPDVDLADIHGQGRFNFAHAAIPREQSKRLLDWAFHRDYERNGPSIYRLTRTMRAGGAIGTIPIRGCAAECAATARIYAPATAPRSTRWRSTCAGRTRTSAAGSASYASGWSASSAGSHAGWITPPDRCCSGRRGATPADSPPGASSSRGRSSSAATGRSLPVRCERRRLSRPASR
jgi:hypothetical protein